MIKELQPGQVVIMDNAAFHKSRKTKVLPPYSQDLNPIEKF
nr:hypothetical protein [Candidatus Sarmatiella mevalonica]